MTPVAQPTPPVLTTLLERLNADGGRYLLSVALTSEERQAQPEPTFGSKGHSRWLTKEEHTALCAVLACNRFDALTEANKKLVDALTDLMHRLDDHFHHDFGNDWKEQEQARALLATLAQVRK